MKIFIDTNNREKGGFSIEDAIMEAFKLGAETAAEAIEEEIDY